MNLLESSGPIIACSSGTSTNTAISVIRLSGFSRIDDIIEAFSIDKFVPRNAHFCNLIDGNQLFDEIIAIFFKAPYSYTGENLLELNVHGNRLNVEKIINYFTSRFNFRRALPGEFTYRALQNGKLNLAQVEGLDLLLNASSDFMLGQGFSLMSGSLQSDYLKLQATYLKYRSSIELSIDFLDDVGEEASSRMLSDSFDEFKSVVEALYLKVNRTNHNLNKPDVVIFGDPNSGKSSLFNNLLNDNRSIITDVKGTTRDFISEDYKIKDVYFTLLDTAGIRETTDIVEREGVERSINKASKGFYKIFVINLLDYNESNLKDYLQLKPDLIIFTHSDKLSSSSINQFLLNVGSIGPEKSGPIGPEKSGPIGPEKSGPIGPDLTYIAINNNDFSNLERDGLNELIYKKFDLITANNPISLERHKSVIIQIHELLVDYSKLLKLEDDISIISSELSAIGNCISELIGIVSADDVLHNIFDNFCIGK